MIISPKQPIDRWSIVKRVRDLLAILAVVFPAIGWAFIGGYLASDPQTVASFSAPIDSAWPRISSTGAIWIGLVFATLIGSGSPFVRITVPPGALRIRGWDRVRFQLFAGMWASSILVLATLQAHWMITGSMVSDLWLLLLPAGALIAIPSIFKNYSRPEALKNVIPATALAIICWMCLTLFAMKVAVLIGIAHHYAPRTDIRPFFDEVVFLTLGAVGALAVSERRWAAATMLAGMGIYWYILNDAHGFCTVPLRMASLIP